MLAFEMKFLNFSVAFLSKLKRNSIISSCEKISFFRHKNCVFSTAFSSFIFPSYRYFSVTDQSKIYSSLFTGGKRFQETENIYAHQVMEKLSHYSSCLLKHPFQNDNCVTNTVDALTSGPLNAVDKFVHVTLQNMTEGSSLENVKFKDVVEKVCSDLPGTSDENIKKILHHLCLWPYTSSTNTENFKIFWNLLDQECVKRLKRWDVSQKLLIGDYWFHLKLSRISHYNSALIYNLMQNIDSLSNHQVVQLMFYINLQRRIPDHFVPSLERKLEGIINFLTLEEVGIVCLGFFKTQNKISSVNVIKSIIEKFMHNVENLNTVTVVAILKFLRKSMSHSLIHLYILTLHKCISCIDNFDIPTSVHLALLSSECNVYHPLLLNCVSERLAGDMNNVRIKDCAKFLLSLSLYNHFEGNFLDLFIAELEKEKRVSEIISHSKHVVSSVLYYSYMGHYNYDLLAKIFRKEFFEKCCLQSPETQATFAEIDYCIEIECPDYTGPKLDASKRKILQNRKGNLPSKSKNQNMQTRLLSDVYDTLVEILGSKNVLIRHILPHVYSPDIIARLSGNMEKSLIDLCQNVPSDFVLKPPKDEVWAAFVVCGTYSFAYKSSQMTAIPLMKLRQLKKIGYHVTSIPYFNVYRNASRRKDFLKEKLNMLDEGKNQIGVF